MLKKNLLKLTYLYLLYKFTERTLFSLLTVLLGFPSFGYMPAPAPPSERPPHASPAFYAATEIFGAAPGSHVTSHVTAGVQRTEPSQLPVSSSPLHRDFTQRTTGIILLRFYHY